jgi:hypothetical protein
LGSAVPSTECAQCGKPRTTFVVGSGTESAIADSVLLPAKYRDGLVKLPLGPNDSLREGAKGRLYFHFPHLRPGAVGAIVQRIDRDSALFRLTGPPIAPPSLDTIPKERQVRLSGSWVWTWDGSDSSSTCAACDEV